MNICDTALPIPDGRTSVLTELGPAPHAAAAADEQQFASAFAGMAARVARPMFERFARLAVRRGFAAIVREEVDAHNNPRLSLIFIPERGAQLATAPWAECQVSLKGILAEQAVEYAACHDPHQGRNGVMISKSDLQSITMPLLENNLEDFLRRALEARQAN